MSVGGQAAKEKRGRFFFPKEDRTRTSIDRDSKKIFKRGLTQNWASPCGDVYRVSPIMNDAKRQKIIIIGKQLEESTPE
ncbi:hypothetical protein ACLOJK_001023 [Asimina triloba]